MKVRVRSAHDLALLQHKLAELVDAAAAQHGESLTQRQLALLREFPAVVFDQIAECVDFVVTGSEDEQEIAQLQLQLSEQKRELDELLARVVAARTEVPARVKAAVTRQLARAAARAHGDDASAMDVDAIVPEDADTPSVPAEQLKALRQNLCRTADELSRACGEVPASLKHTQDLLHVLRDDAAMRGVAAESALLGGGQFPHTSNFQSLLAAQLRNE
eukprot:gnl/Spiro4/3775_TR1857_c0_g1_i1.p2 gnl/Spiro4/3775_TR1857_c0_g1~~gnl/Spiro4/3775_TR1857_c0_g1_i1.p2  ORF type:complete len:250 (+),score=80.69 gnl/Spiro4/3775_TR1857_c0_g1_i1:97-750(+)